MKISDYKNEDAIELLADLLDPVEEIATDDEVKAAMTGDNVVPMRIAKVILKKHPKAIMEIFARIDGTAVDEYEISVPEILGKLIGLFNDKEFMAFFT